MYIRDQYNVKNITHYTIDNLLMIEICFILSIIVWNKAEINITTINCIVAMNRGAICNMTVINVLILQARKFAVITSLRRVVSFGSDDDDS